ncbi:MAG: hypothetical protein NTV34_03685, partial [Proteobacteria bacterium]|nr:hypothetical protein [Pseudomonadota bacterium]
KPAIHVASVWDSVDRPLGECLEIVESLEGITFQRAWGMSRILWIRKSEKGSGTNSQMARRVLCTIGS